MGSGASDLEHLGGGGEVHPLRGLEGLDGAPHPPTVRALDRGGGWDVLPGQGLERPVQGLLVVLDRQEVVTATPADPLGGVHLGVHGVSGHHCPVQVEGVKQVPESRDLVGLARHPPPAPGPAQRPWHGPTPPEGAAPGPRWCARSAHGLAIHRDHPATVDGAGARVQPGC